MFLKSRIEELIVLPVLLAASAFTQITNTTQPAPTTGPGGAGDPGIRGGSPGAGKPFASGMTTGDLAFFNITAVTTFKEVEAVASGLGPRFNLNSCAGCHALPAVGGSSPPTGNPQVVLAPSMAPGNSIPSFLAINGPVRVVRMVKNADGTPNGGVKDIFTIAGRHDSPPGCQYHPAELSLPRVTSSFAFRLPLLARA